MEKEILIGQKLVSYFEQRQGIPFIILEGWDDSPEKYLKFQEILSNRGYKVYLLILPGLAKDAPLKEAWSTKEYAGWLFEATENLGIKKFFLYGHSLGSLIAMRFAALYPKKLFGLILAPAPKPGKGLICPIRFITWTGKLLPLLNKIKKFFPQKIGCWIEKQYGIYERSSGKMFDTLKTVFSEDFDSYISDIRAPLLIVYGKKDNCFCIDSAKELHRKIPDSSLKGFEKANHYVQEICPEELSDEIEKFAKAITSKISEIKLQPIGYVRNNQIRDPKRKNWSEIKSKIILNPELTKALEGLEHFPHLIVISWLHQITEGGKKRKRIICPSSNNKLRGVFATRAPFRPNPIGITCVKLISVRKNVLEVLGLDVFDGTPILDIKPYTGYPKDSILDSRLPES